MAVRGDENVREKKFSFRMKNRNQLRWWTARIPVSPKLAEKKSQRGARA